MDVDGERHYPPILLVALALALLLAVPTSRAAAQPGSADKMIVVHDIVRGSNNVSKDQAPVRVCVLNSRFLHNEEVVWRIKVVDPRTGDFLDGKALSKVEVKLASGEIFTAKYGTHPRQNPTDYFWTTAWTIAEGYPTGAVPYTITAAHADGRTGMSVTFNVNLSQLTILAGAVPAIPK